MLGMKLFQTSVFIHGAGDGVRLHVVFVSAVHPVASPVVAVVGDGRSGDPLHERGDKRDVYEGEVAGEFGFGARLAG